MMFKPALTHLLATWGQCNKLKTQNTYKAVIEDMLAKSSLLVSTRKAALVPLCVHPVNLSPIYSLILSLVSDY